MDKIQVFIDHISDMDLIDIIYYTAKEEKSAQRELLMADKAKKHQYQKYYFFVQCTAALFAEGICITGFDPPESSRLRPVLDNLIRKNQLLPSILSQIE